jgi:uncharacterized membrane protein YoaK (UPF0700 family)
MEAELTSTTTNQARDVQVRMLLVNLLTISSGAIDAISFIELGKVFSAFMTGNIAFLGMLAGGEGGPTFARIIAAMGGFAAGVYLATWIVDPKINKASGVWPRRVTLTIGLAILWHASFVVLWFACGGRPSPNVAHFLIAFWGLAMGMQSAAVRSLHVEGVFTTAATATFIFLFSDYVTWTQTEEERRRLWGVVVSLFIGATAGSLLLLHAHILAPVLPLVATILVAVTASIAFRDRKATADASTSNERALGAN